MKSCDLVTSMGRLRKSASYLKEKWEATTEHWNDATRHKFEQDFLQPLAPHITLTVASIQELAELLQQAERECEEEREVML